MTASTITDTSAAAIETAAAYLEHCCAVDYDGNTNGCEHIPALLRALSAELQHLRHAAQESEKDAGWRDIASAPMDGRIMVYNSATGIYLTTFLNGEWPMQGWGLIAGTWYPKPSHWRELPKAPK